MNRPVFRFAPARWPTLAFLALLPLLLGLGVWQLDRAEQKRSLLSEIRSAAEAEPVPLAEAGKSYHGERLVRVTAEGRYDAERQFLLDNQIENGRVGYRVMTPLILEGSPRALLVDRGWRAAPLTRGRLPELNTPEGPQRVAGVLGDGPSTGLRLGAAMVEDEAGWPRRIQYLDFEALQAVLPYPLEGAVLETDDPVQARLESLAAFGPERHMGYAVQWFALAAALCVLYIVVNLRRVGRDD